MHLQLSIGIPFSSSTSNTLQYWQGTVWKSCSLTGNSGLGYVSHFVADERLITRIEELFVTKARDELAVI